MSMQIHFVLFIICAQEIHALKIEDEYSIGVSRYAHKIGQSNSQIFGKRRYKYTMPHIYFHNPQYGTTPAQYGMNHQENEIFAHQYPHLYGPPVEQQYGHQPLQSTKQAIMEALFLLAKNDNLQCVPKILCEMTSGMASGRQSTLNLPINVNLETILSFLSTLKGVGSSPLIYVSAALLGYTSKGSSGQCTRTFPNCPSDPDKLVQYLNQHNGGFFRFFSGVNPSIDLNSQNFRKAKETSHLYAPFHEKHLKTTRPEERIQTRPTVYIPLNGDFKDEGNVFDSDDPRKYRHPKGLRFPPEEINLHLSEPTESLKFPENYEDYEYSHKDSYRRPKELQYEVSYNQNSLNLQRPLPNHRPSTMIFPIRTGTGELKLDPDELEVQNQPTFFDESKDDTRITFQSEQDSPSSEEHENYRHGNSIFTFPS